MLPAGNSVAVPDFPRLLHAFRSNAGLMLAANLWRGRLHSRRKKKLAAVHVQRL
jgi:hypothetical protein